MTADSKQNKIVSKISYKGTEVVVLEHVYEPAEDSFLLADCAVSFLSDKFPEKKTKPPFHILEVGCGSGFVSAFVQSRFPCVSLTAVDINPNAVTCACENGVNAFLSDLFDRVSADLTPTGYDLILFNPPYLPTQEDEKVTGWLNYAFDGGVSGQDAINKFLESVSDYLSKDGIFLLLISSLTGLDGVCFKMKTNGFAGEIVGREKYPFEELMVLKGSRQ